jgi:hypothetical protein
MLVRGVTLAVVLVLALVGASCGGDDSDTAGDTDTVVTETEGITAEETTTDDTTDDGSFATSECSTLVTAAASVATAFSATGETSEVEEARAQFEELAENAPDEISDDLQVLAEAYDEFVDVLDDAGFEPGETPTADAIQELQAAIATIDQPEVTEAAANVEAWTTANC